MKKTIGIFAAAMICVSVLSACGGSEAIVSSSNEEGEFLISSQNYRKEFFSENGKTLLGTSTFTLPMMRYSSDDASSERIVEAFNDEINSFYKEQVRYWDDAMEGAVEQYNSFGSENWPGAHWAYDIAYEVTQTEKLVSLRYEHYVFSGGAHGYTYFTSQLFDIEEGTDVQLIDLTDDIDALSQTVTNDILRQIEAEELDLQFGYWSDYAEYVANWMEEEHSVYINADGNMEIIYPAYELASYAAGPQTFVVEQSVYGTCLNDYGKELLEMI